MSVDMRRFKYMLEPVLDQRRWQLEALQGRLGSLQQRINAEEELINTLQSQHAIQSQEAARILLQRINPEGHARSLQWLSQLRARIATAQMSMEELNGQRLALLAECMAVQCKINAIETHREESVRQFATDESARMAAEADRDWLARSSHANLSSAPASGETRLSSRSLTP